MNPPNRISTLHIINRLFDVVPHKVIIAYVRLWCQNLGDFRSVVVIMFGHCASLSFNHFSFFTRMIAGPSKRGTWCKMLFLSFFPSTFWCTKKFFALSPQHICRAKYVHPALTFTNFTLWHPNMALMPNVPVRPTTKLIILPKHPTLLEERTGGSMSIAKPSDENVKLTLRSMLNFKRYVSFPFCFRFHHSKNYCYQVDHS